MLSCNTLFQELKEAESVNRKQLFRLFKIERSSSRDI